MPVMGGIEATQKIRQDEKNATNRIPIIALTAHAFPEDEERCKAAGMDGFVSKPINRDALIKTIRSFVREALS